MTDDERSEAEPLEEEAPHRAPEEVAAHKAAEISYPAVGHGGDMTGDDESLARRPAQDEDEIDGDTDKGGTPPGTATHGA